MSFIHEALKRSDRARRMLGASRLEPADATLSVPRRARWVPWILALLLANLALLAWFSWHAFAPQTLQDSPQHLGGEVRSLQREAATTDAADPQPSLRSDADPGAVPALDALPPDLQARLPPLHLDAHAWSEDPAQRFVIIDLKRRVVGDALDGGATLVEITADGVVIEFEGRRAKIARQ